MPYDPTTGVQSGKKPQIAATPKEPAVEPSGSPAQVAEDIAPVNTNKVRPKATPPEPVFEQEEDPTSYIDSNGVRQYNNFEYITSRKIAQRAATNQAKIARQQAAAQRQAPSRQQQPAAQPPAVQQQSPTTPAAQQQSPVSDLQQQMGDPNSRFNKMSRDEVLSMVPWLKDDPNFANMSDGDLRFLAGQYIGQQIKNGDMGQASNWAGQLRAFGAQPAAGTVEQPVLANKPAVQPNPVEEKQPEVGSAPQPGGGSVQQPGGVATQQPGNGAIQQPSTDLVSDLERQLGDPNSRFNKMNRDEVLSMAPWLRNDPNFANMSDGDLRFLAGQHIGKQIKSGDMGAAANWAGQLQSIGGGGGANPSVEQIAGNMRGRNPMMNDPEWNRVPPGGFGSPNYGGNGRDFMDRFPGGMSQEQLNERMRLLNGIGGMGGNQMPTGGPTISQMPVQAPPGGWARTPGVMAQDPYRRRTMTQMPVQAPPGGWPQGNAVDGGMRPGSIPGYGQPQAPPQMAGPSQGNSPVQQMPPQMPGGGPGSSGANWAPNTGSFGPGGVFNPGVSGGGAQVPPDQQQAVNDILNNLLNDPRLSGLLNPGAPGGMQESMIADYLRNRQNNGQMQNIAPQTPQSGLGLFNPLGTGPRGPRTQQY